MRYLPLTADDRADMLKAIGAKSVDDFYGDVPTIGPSQGPRAEPAATIRASSKSSAT